MEAACAEAVALGLPAVAFTEHVDLSAWYVPAASLHMFPREGAEYAEADSTFRPPPVDLSLIHI